MGGATPPFQRHPANTDQSWLHAGIPLLAVGCRSALDATQYNVSDMGHFELDSSSGSRFDWARKATSRRSLLGRKISSGARQCVRRDDVPPAVRHLRAKSRLRAEQGWPGSPTASALAPPPHVACSPPCWGQDTRPDGARASGRAWWCGSTVCLSVCASMMLHPPHGVVQMYPTPTGGVVRALVVMNPSISLLVLTSLGYPPFLHDVTQGLLTIPSVPTIKCSQSSIRPQVRQNLSPTGSSGFRKSIYPLCS